MADVRPRRDLEAPAPVSDPDENVRPLRERPGEMAPESARGPGHEHMLSAEVKQSGHGSLL